ncbi:dienelactone hydrolase family protein [Fodinicola acaciae]|uniref:dienelactone hydrolase family protein n=1 Tax=Fodinicola acaciae TaxID=2681555 RepID=UPI0013D34DA1|nr:dienelactone hydrolase family protein [Fodinicola acaciae]
MCYSENDAVPAAPGDEGPVSGTHLHLTAADGGRYPAYLATPERQSGAPILLLPDAGGLHSFYFGAARRFAGLGHPTLAIDYYGRTAESDSREDDDFEHLPHQQKLRREAMLLDVRAGVDHLATVADGDPYVLGFCLGGGTALLAGTTDIGLAGVVAFYPYTGELGPDEPALPDDFVTAMRRPVLGLFGDADAVIPTAVPRAYDDFLDKAGVPHEIVIYPGAPHGFFERHYLEREARPDTLADVWQRLTTFFAA